jgi:ethanolamine ammonia-lyase small subunit
MSAPDRWSHLRSLTAARIGLGRAGPGIATADHLAFRAAHALARDAVHAALDVDAVAGAMLPLGLTVLQIESRCPDQATFLTRPDLGRRLAPASAIRLRDAQPAEDIAVLVAGGLSALATGSHAAALLALLVPLLRGAGHGVGPISLAPRGRVALGDEVGEILRARLMLVLIGERPGLSSPDSLGAYLTFAPKVGRTDADRNCISNIRPQGMALAEAARRVAWLTDQALVRRVSGVTLKDDSDRLLVAAPIHPRPLPAGEG